MNWKQIVSLIVMGIAIMSATGCKSKTTIIEPTKTVEVPAPDHHDDHHPPPPPPDHHGDRH